MHDLPEKSVATVVVRTFLVVGSVIIGAMILISHFQKPQPDDAYDVCVDYLRQLDEAKEQWALENNAPIGTEPPSNVVAQYVKGGQIPNCRDGGTYSLNAIGQKSTCSVGGSGHSSR